MASELANPQTDRASLKLEGRVFEITKAVSFEAAHYMGTKPEGHPYRGVHGHSFGLEATVAGIVKPGEQWVEDFAHLTTCLTAAAAKLDHRLLNEVEGLEIPTLERICLWAARELSQTLPGLKRVAVTRPSLSERCELVL